MLTPDQITALRDASSQLVDPIVDFLIGDIAQRVSEAGQLTGTAAYQVWQADFSVAYRKYLVYTDTTAQEKALKELSDIYGFTFVKL